MPGIWVISVPGCYWRVQAVSAGNSHVFINDLAVQNDHSSHYLWGRCISCYCPPRGDMESCKCCYWDSCRDLSVGRWSEEVTSDLSPVRAIHPALVLLGFPSGHVHTAQISHRQFCCEFFRKSVLEMKLWCGSASTAFSILQRSVFCTDFIQGVWMGYKMYVKYPHSHAWGQNARGLSAPWTWP